MALLEIRNLSHHFGGLSALTGVGLDLEPHDLTGVIGPNGAGKTTLFNIVTGVYHPVEGSISLEGTEITGLAPHRINRLGIARTFQNIRLFKDLTVIDNVRTAFFARSGYGTFSALVQSPSFRRHERGVFDRTMDLLSLFGLEPYAYERSRNLPYGLQRRLEIVRALATEPKVLLLDEPAAGMNPNEVAGLMDLILWVKNEFCLTILLIEHQMQLVMNICEHLVVLDFGIVIAEGPPHEIRCNAKVLEAYLGEDVTA